MSKYGETSPTPNTSPVTLAKNVAVSAAGASELGTNKTDTISTTRLIHTIRSLIRKHLSVVIIFSVLLLLAMIGLVVFFVLRSQQQSAIGTGGMGNEEKAEAEKTSEPEAEVFTDESGDAKKSLIIGVSIAGAVIFLIVLGIIFLRYRASKEPQLSSVTLEQRRSAYNEMLALFDKRKDLFSSADFEKCNARQGGPYHVMVRTLKGSEKVIYCFKDYSRLSILFAASSSFPHSNLKEILIRDGVTERDGESYPLYKIISLKDFDPKLDYESLKLQFNSMSKRETDLPEARKLEVHYDYVWK
jgi:flagellar basal body-associated protein FliL